MGLFGFGNKSKESPENPDNAKQELSRQALERQKVILMTDTQLTSLAKEYEREHPEQKKYEAIIV